MDQLVRVLGRVGGVDYGRVSPRALASCIAVRQEQVGAVDAAEYRTLLESSPGEYLRFVEELVRFVADDARRNRQLADDANEREERFRQLAENIHEVFWLTDWTANRVLYVSPAYETVWGRPCESLYADPRSWAHAIHPDDQRRVVDAFVAGAAEGSYDVEYRLVRDGEERWIHDRAYPILDASGRVYRVTGISADVTARRRMEEELRDARDDLEERVRERTSSLAEAYDALRRLSSEALLAEDRERRKLAVDLHDGLGQVISLVGMKLGALGATPHPEALTEVRALVSSANRMARSLTFQLSPPVLYDLGLEPAIQWLADDVRTAYGLVVSLTDDGRDKPADLRVRISLFRAVRELLINVAKHATVGAASVELSRERDWLRIVVEDRGHGFDPTTGAKCGYGLFAIRERLRHLGGDIHVCSEPGHGTRVTLTAPIDSGDPTS